MRTGPKAKPRSGWKHHRCHGWGRRLMAKYDKPMRERRRARRRRHRRLLAVVAGAFVLFALSILAGL